MGVRFPSRLTEEGVCPTWAILSLMGDTGKNRHPCRFLPSKFCAIPTEFRARRSPKKHKTSAKAIVTAASMRQVLSLMGVVCHLWGSLSIGKAFFQRHPCRPVYCRQCPQGQGAGGQLIPGCSKHLLHAFVRFKTDMFVTANCKAFFVF
jgi:hypothetical protein